MTEEEKNVQKRKLMPLSNSESLLFFFLPFRFSGRAKWENNDYNTSEIQRFKKYGFDLKLKQAKQLTVYGRLFYLSLTIIIIYFVK